MMKVCDLIFLSIFFFLLVVLVENSKMEMSSGGCHFAFLFFMTAGNGGAPLPAPTERRPSGPNLTRNNSIVGQPRTKPRAEGPPVKKKR
jgi:hypothetical protein